VTHSKPATNNKQVGLLEKWYRPSDGQITIDGIDIQHIDDHFLHRHIGLVQQEPLLFATTIRKNITYVVDAINQVIRKEAEESYGKQFLKHLDHMLLPNDDEHVFRAAKDAHAHKFICNLPQGYDTVLGEYGTQLSVKKHSFCLPCD
jgi:ABC-type multidrug transport system fused ATPase/permease subunit